MNAETAFYVSGGNFRDLRKNVNMFTPICQSAEKKVYMVKKVFFGEMLRKIIKTVAMEKIFGWGTFTRQWAPNTLSKISYFSQNLTYVILFHYSENIFLRLECHKIFRLCSKKLFRRPKTWWNKMEEDLVFSWPLRYNLYCSKITSWLQSKKLTKLKQK